MSEAVVLNPLIRWAWNNFLALQQAGLNFTARKAAQLTLDFYRDNPSQVAESGANVGYIEKIADGREYAAAWSKELLRWDCPFLGQTEFMDILSSFR